MIKCFTKNTHVAVVCQCNDPLDDFTRASYELFGKDSVFRFISQSQEAKLARRGEETWKECTRTSNTPFELPTHSCLVIATTSISCGTFQGDTILPTRSFPFVIVDEGQMHGNYETGLLVHLLTLGAILCYFGDRNQTYPHEPPAFHKPSILGDLTRFTM